MLSLDISPEIDFIPALELIRRWSLALTPAQQAELQNKIREGISADAQVAMRTMFREQNAHVIVDQFIEMIKLPELKHFLQHEEHITLIAERMRETLECNFGVLFQKIAQSNHISREFLDRLMQAT